MPYALFSNDAKLSKAYPTEADVWKLAQRSGLVVDAVSEGDMAAPRPVLDNDYEIRPCRADPNEDPARNAAEAERDARLEVELNSQSLAVLDERRRSALPDRRSRRSRPWPGRSKECALTLRRCAYQRCLLRSQRHANLLAMQPPDRAGHLEHFADGTGRILHEGNLVGGEDQGFGFQDSLSKAR